MIGLKLLKDLYKSFHPISGYCKKCGWREEPLFTVWDEDWGAITGNSEKTLCLRCFDRLARSKGIVIVWEPTKVVEPLVKLSASR